MSFSLGISALQPPQSSAIDGCLTLLPGESSIAVQVTAGGGMAVLRVVEDAFELEGAERRLQIDHLVRELRITLGQLPPTLRATVSRLVVCGPTHAAGELIQKLPPRMSEIGLRAERAAQFPSGRFKFHLPADHEASPALALALRNLAAEAPCFEFLPPKVSPWQRLQARYPAGKLAYGGIAVGVVLLAILGAFLIQQGQLRYWQAKWKSMEGDVARIAAMQRDIQTYRPWFDESLRCLTILQRLTETFPESGTVTAKTVEIRPTTVVCSGTAHDHQALLQTLDRLRNVSGVASPQVEQIRGVAPLQFTFNFQWIDGGRP